MHTLRLRGGIAPVLSLLLLTAGLHASGKVADAPATPAGSPAVIEAIAAPASRPAPAEPVATGREAGGLYTDESILSDTGGPIEEIRIHYLPEVAEELASFYHDLLTALSPETRVEIICPSNEAVLDFIERWGDSPLIEEREFRLINVDREITLWARDRQIARRRNQDEQATGTFAPTPGFEYDQDKRNELDLPKVLSEAGLTPPDLSAGLHLEGGNVVSNNHQAFVGINVLEENEALQAASPAEVEFLLSRIIGRPYLLIRDCDGGVPWCHVDMYLTPVDDRMVMVADPKMGLALLLREGDPADRTDLPDFIYDRLDDSVELQARFDSVAGELSRQGYHVLRLPVLVDREEEWMVTYNNVITERRNGRKIIYLPTYEIPELDLAAARIYRGLGFKVHRVDVSQVYDLGGAVRCLVNVTRRRPLETRIEPVRMRAGRIEILRPRSLTARQRS